MIIHWYTNTLGFQYNTAHAGIDSLSFQSKKVSRMPQHWCLLPHHRHQWTRPSSRRLADGTNTQVFHLTLHPRTLHSDSFCVACIVIEDISVTVVEANVAGCDQLQLVFELQVKNIRQN
jgi:hypothetical protein